MEVIRTDALTKSYGKHRGIVEVSLSVEPGNFFGFIGPNGLGCGRYCTKDIALTHDLPLGEGGTA